MKVAVIGGGPAGCAAAYTMRKQGHEVTLFEAQDHVGGRTSQVRKDGFNIGSGALFLMGGIYPRTNALIKELGHEDEMVPWDALTEVIDADGKRYSAKFDQVMSFLRMPVLTWRDKVWIAAGLGKQFLTPGPKRCFDGADLAKWDDGEDLESWSRRVLGDRGHRYITVPYMGFLYAVPASWLSPALFHAVIKQFHKLALSVPPEGAGQIAEWLVEGADGLDLRLSSPAEAITREPLQHMSDDDIVKSALDAVQEVYGTGPEPDFVELFHYRRGLSIADPGHYGRLDSLHEEMPVGIYLAGDYFAHAGIEAAIFSGQLAANRLDRAHRDGVLPGA